MSLNGNLEDLPLLDILQIVSFSKKTGYLSISNSGGEGAIVFHDGYVVASFTDATPPLDPRAQTLPVAKRDALLRNRIGLALEQLIRLREGHFSFSLTSDAPRMVGTRDITPETLSNGINAQELLIDLARGMDEDRRDSTAALEASFAEAPPGEQAPPPEAGPEAALPAEAIEAAPIAPVEDLPPEPSAASPAPPSEESAPSAPVEPGPLETPAEELRTILLVDDEEDVRRVLAGHFTQGGYQVVEAEDPDVAVKKAHKLGKAHLSFILVTDLGMPTSGGTSFHGGFEVVKRLWKMNLQPPVLLMTETLDSALQARARQMGVANFVFKPGLSKLDPEQFDADLRAFAGKILTDILPRLSEAATQAAAAPKRKAVPAAAEPAPVVPAGPDEVSREFAMLLKRLEALRRPQDATQISALVMKVSREFFERAILLVVKSDELRGLGGFGLAPREQSLHLLVRDVLIPLGEPSVFSRAVAGRKPFSGPLPDEKWTRYLLGKVGRFKSGEGALLPLLTHRETIALLFGDNPDSGRPLGRLDGLVVFINQAGIALENAFLQRKVHALQGQE
jgi:CheY-like chemotaxis protein